jgi:Trk K+ transport system NAD-binding subunit
MNDIVWLTMRRMRSPLILLILVYSLTVFGMVLIPGQDEAGNTVHVGYLDASYFVAVMATTIGFGEIPVGFTQAQRLYVFIMLFPNVVAWLYSIGTILGLIIDPQFRAVLRHSRFAWGVRWIGSDYYIICGFGNTGNMIVQGLLKRGINAVVLEREDEVVHSMALNDNFAHIPALAGDVTDRNLLDAAGLNARNQHCIGVIAITNEDHANLTVAITSKLLRKDLPVLARSETRRVSANMASFGTEYTIDPYSIFAERLFLALKSPLKYLVQDWLISAPGGPLCEPVHPPSGLWIICGLGRFGSRMAARLDEAGISYNVIDVHPDRVEGRQGAVLGRGTEAHTLQEAGIMEAEGIIAGTGDDVDNLSIIMTALGLNSDLFVVARQERRENDELFDLSGAHLVARRSFIVARRILGIATTPLMAVFVEHLISQNDQFAQKVWANLRSVLKGRAPNLWITHLTGEMAQGVRTARKEHITIRLEHIIQNVRTEDPEPLNCVCLVLERGAMRLFLPDSDETLMEGDRMLFAGRSSARREMFWGLSEPNALIGFATGKHLPRGAIWRWWWHKRRGRQS